MSILLLVTLVVLAICLEAAEAKKPAGPCTVANCKKCNRTGIKCKKCNDGFELGNPIKKKKSKTCVALVVVDEEAVAAAAAAAAEAAAAEAAEAAAAEAAAAAAALAAAAAAAAAAAEAAAAEAAAAAAAEAAAAEAAKNELFRKDEELQLVRNTVIGTIPIMYKDYHVQFDVKANSFIPNSSYSPWQSVIQFTDDRSDFNIRNPGVWFVHMGTAVDKLFVSSNINGDNKFPFVGDSLSAGVWMNIQIQQTLISGDNYLYEILKDGVVIFSIENSQAIELTNVAIYASNDWHTALDGSIRNLRVSR